MKTDSPSVSGTTAVFFGAVLLVGVPAMGLTATFFGQVLAVLGVADAVGSGGFVGDMLLVVPLVGSILVGLQVALEAAALQLHGTAALTRGSTLSVLFRHVLLSLCALVVLGTSVWLGLSQVVTTDSLWPAVGSGLLGVAGLVVLARYLRQFTVGYQAEQRSAP
jgi:hypothetical protein